MSLEDQIGRLANAVAMQSEGTAVAEIIRQRDAAFKERDRWKRDADFYMERRDENYRSWEAERRRSAALRGVITRMKSTRENKQ